MNDALIRIFAAGEIPAKYRYIDQSRLHEWEAYFKQLNAEYRQCEDEGLDIAPLKPAFERIIAMDDCPEKQYYADKLFEEIRQLPVLAGYSYHEPDKYEDISAASESSYLSSVKPDMATLRPKIAGAWYGRIAGCLLGKTVEGIRTCELIPFLKSSGNYPMHRYIYSSDVPENAKDLYRFNFSVRVFADKLSSAPADDDTNYTCLYQALIEKYGRDFNSSDVCSIWLSRQPKTAYCTAERAAYRNMSDGIQPPDTAVYQNAYREWIGAQIRGDYFGYINPGDPVEAAKMAWKDAAVSHIKNGIYGEMLIAAMLARAAVSDDIIDIINTSLRCIPSNCRLSEKLRQLLEKYEHGLDEAGAFSWIHSCFDEKVGHGWCHTISNALIVCASLLYGKNDYGRSICMAVQTGFDTDCNGATVGSILGMKNGFSSIDPYWLEPLHGKLDTNIAGMACVSIEELIDKTMSHLAL
ncbi:MAG: ADP-ribosylglycohydrolase family protein [Clostridia bacterium]|nr:ADP-ribosylglycohydrolase family protein [Clostridia bacterium]